MSSKPIPAPPAIPAHAQVLAQPRTVQVPAKRVSYSDPRFKSGVITRSHTEADARLTTRDFKRMMSTTRYGTSR